MARLGKKQLGFLAGMVGTGVGTGRAAVVGDALIHSLVARGCMRPLGPQGDSFFVVTPAGLRAVADALDAGTIPAVTIDAFKPKERV